MVEGIDIGIERGKIEAAINGIKAGFLNDIIITITALSGAQIDNLRAELA